MEVEHQAALVYAALKETQRSLVAACRTEAEWQTVAHLYPRGAVELQGICRLVDAMSEALEALHLEIHDQPWTDAVRELHEAVVAVSWDGGQPWPSIENLRWAMSANARVCEAEGGISSGVAFEAAGTGLLECVGSVPCVPQQSLLAVVEGVARMREHGEEALSHYRALSQWSQEGRLGETAGEGAAWLRALEERVEWMEALLQGPTERWGVLLRNMPTERLVVSL